MKTLKTVILIATMGMISYNTLAQKTKDIPQPVRDDFAARYPQSHLRHWREENNQYVASFRYNDRNWESTWSRDGRWISSERIMRHLSNVPGDVIASLRNSRYASYHIDEARAVQTPKTNLYMLEVDNNSGNKMIYDNIGSFDDQLLYFSHDGRLLKSVNNSNE